MSRAYKARIAASKGDIDVDLQILACGNTAIDAVTFQRLAMDRLNISVTLEYAETLLRAARAGA